jgi:hypothetical protein
MLDLDKILTSPKYYCHQFKILLSMNLNSFAQYVRFRQNFNKSKILLSKSAQLIN